MRAKIIIHGVVSPIFIESADFILGRRPLHGAFLCPPRTHVMFSNLRLQHLT